MDIIIILIFLSIFLANDNPIAIFFGTSINTDDEYNRWRNSLPPDDDDF